MGFTDLWLAATAGHEGMWALIGPCHNGWAVGEVLMRLATRKCEGVKKKNKLALQSEFRTLLQARKQTESVATCLRFKPVSLMLHTTFLRALSKHLIEYLTLLLLPLSSCCSSCFYLFIVFFFFFKERIHLQISNNVMNVPTEMTPDLFNVCHLQGMFSSFHMTDRSRAWAADPRPLCWCRNISG